jgi:hypothetical protein
MQKQNLQHVSRLFFSTPLLVNEALQDPMLPAPTSARSTVISRSNSLPLGQCKAKQIDTTLSATAYSTNKTSKVLPIVAETH